MNRLSQIKCGLFLVALVALQCSVFDPPDLRIGTNEGGIGATDTGPVIETGPDSTTVEEPWWKATNEYGCEIARTPSKLDRPDPGKEGDSLAPIYLAISRMRFGTTNDDEALTENRDAWKDIGIDRDGRCTDSPTCAVDGMPVNEPSCTGSALLPISQEGNRCIDNAMGSMFAMGTIITGNIYSPREFFGMSDPDWNCELHRGGFSMIFKLSDYNGLENDPSVRVDMYVSTGLQFLPAWSCRDTIESPLSDNWYQNAPWAAINWQIAKRSVSPSAMAIWVGIEVPDSKTFDAEAFVRDGFLFAELTDGQEFALAGDRTPIPGIRTIMHKPILLAKLFRDQDTKPWQMDDGILSFYIKPEEFINAIREIGFCKNLCGTYVAMTAFLENGTDVLLTGELQPDIPCTGLSTAVDFEADQVSATFEDIVDIAEPTDCPEPRHPGVPRNCTCDEKTGKCVEGTTPPTLDGI